MIPKNKKRVSLTLHEDIYNLVKTLKPLLKVRTESEVVEFSLVALGDAIFHQMNEQINKGEQSNEKN